MGDEDADEVVGQPEAAVVLEGVDEGADVAVVAGGDEGAGEGGAPAEAVGADEVGAFGEGGFRAADQTGGGDA